VFCVVKFREAIRSRFRSRTCREGRHTSAPSVIILVEQIKIAVIPEIDLCPNTDAERSTCMVRRHAPVYFRPVPRWLGTGGWSRLIGGRPGNDKSALFPGLI